MHHLHHFHLHLKTLLIVFFVTLFLIFLLLIGKGNPVTEIMAFMKAHLLFGTLTYFFYTVLSVIIIPLPVIPLWPFALYLYGFWPGVIITTTAIITGSLISFLLARNFGKRIVIKIIGTHLFAEVEHLTTINNPKTFFLIRLFGNNYFDTVSYVVGLSKISLFTYFTITAVVTTAWTIALFALIQQAGGLDNIQTFLSLMTGYAFLILLGTFLWELYHHTHIAKFKKSHRSV